jgi:titin
MSWSPFSRLRPAKGRQPISAASRIAARRKRPAIESLEGRQLLAQVFTVTNSADSPAGSPDIAGSLRAAIDQANASPAGTVTSVDFAINTGPQTISLLQPLPVLGNPLIIDGTTQPGYAGRPLISVDGAQAGAGAIGFQFTDDSANSTVKALEVNDFNGGGVNLNNSTGDTFTNDYIGVHQLTNLFRSAGNGTYGIELTNQANNNTLSGLVVAGNAYNGVVINNSMQNTLTSSWIGTDTSGESSLDRNGVSLGNGVAGGGGSGIVINGGANHNTISNDVVVNNASYGVYISDLSTSFNQILNSKIGTDATGTTALPNALDGVAIVSGASQNQVGLPGQGNVISGNGHSGVFLSGADAAGNHTSLNTVAGNKIGTNLAGSAALPNALDGVAVTAAAVGNVVGTTQLGGGNLISGNTEWGVYISDTGTNANVVQQNDIGTDVGGTFAVPNGFNGLDVFNGAQSNTVGGTTAAARNVISGNAHEGVLVGGANTSSNIVEGNFIGTNALGNNFLANSAQLDGVYVGLGAGANTIGGQNPVGAFNTQAWNVISGNSASGILVTDSGTTGEVISGNFIGTDLTGTALLANGGNGITIAAGTSNTTVGAQTTGISNLNVISGNLGDGISISSSGNNISFNYLGVDLNNTKALGNRGNGVSIHSVSGNRVNLDVIRNSGGYGILTDTGANHNAWYYDSIYGNTQGGIATPTNPSPQPAPVLTMASSGNGHTTVTGTVIGSPYTTATLVIQFYASPAAGSPQAVQGLTFLGQANATTDAHGNASFTATLNSGVPIGQVVTATADFNVSSTSVFSSPITVIQAPAANNQSVTGGFNAPVAITLTGSDPNTPPLPLTFSVTALPAHGILSGTAPHLTYTPVAGFVGTDGFQFKDNNGVVDSNIATVTITVTAAQTLPNIAGSYFIAGNKTTQVQQNGSSLTFINENNQSSPGTFLSPTQVVATGWGNLVGNLVSIDDGIRIAWTNGTAWDQPQLTGQGFIGTKIVQVVQSGTTLTFTNENGGTSAGYVADATHVVATTWGNLVGTLTPTFEGFQINWANGTAWTMPRLGGSWSYNGQTTQVVQPANGTALTFINEAGESSAGLIQDATHIVATGWGNLAGTLVALTNGQIEIQWANGTAWVKPQLPQ